MGEDGDWVGLGGVGKLRRYGPIIKRLKVVCILKKQIKIFTTGLQGNYPTIMVNPPVEYLKMCNFPQIAPFPRVVHLCSCKMVQCALYTFSRYHNGIEYLALYRHFHGQSIWKSTMGVLTIRIFMHAYTSSDINSRNNFLDITS